MVIFKDEEKEVCTQEEEAKELTDCVAGRLASFALMGTVLVGEPPLRHPPAAISGGKA